MTRYTGKELQQQHISKRDLFLPLDKQGIVYDSALPQQWLDNFTARHKIDYYTVLYSTVWVYPKGFIFGFPVSACTEVQHAIDQEFPQEEPWNSTKN